MVHVLGECECAASEPYAEELSLPESAESLLNLSA